MGENEPPFEALAIVMQQARERPGDGRFRGEQDQRVSRAEEGIEGLDCPWASHTAATIELVTIT